MNFLFDYVDHNASHMAAAFEEMSLYRYSTYRNDQRCRAISREVGWRKGRLLPSTIWCGVTRLPQNAFSSPVDGDPSGHNVKSNSRALRPMTARHYEASAIWYKLPYWHGGGCQGEVTCTGETFPYEDHPALFHLTRLPFAP
jgi:hypothetical protein